MTQRLPPLDTFRYFETAARHLNFSRAAEELCVTHGAVSQRIKSLEAHLGVRLFERRGRSMRLTGQGHQLENRVRSALNDLSDAVELVRTDENDKTLIISVLPAFAVRWLIPRLAHFKAINPQIEVNISASQTLTDLEKDGVDLAVRFGGGSWPGLRAKSLFAEQVFPVSSPKFYISRMPTEPHQLLGLPLLHDQRQPWTIWFDAVGGIQVNQALPGPTYSDAQLLLEAAIAGHGVALARASFVKPDLDAGRLVRLFSQSAKTRYSHFLVYPARSEGKHKIATFRS